MKPTAPASPRRGASRGSVRQVAPLPLPERTALSRHELPHRAIQRATEQGIIMEFIRSAKPIPQIGDWRDTSRTRPPVSSRKPAPVASLTSLAGAPSALTARDPPPRPLDTPPPALPQRTTAATESMQRLESYSRLGRTKSFARSHVMDADRLVSKFENTFTSQPCMQEHRRRAQADDKLTAEQRVEQEMTARYRFPVLDCHPPAHFVSNFNNIMAAILDDPLVGDTVPSAGEERMSPAKAAGADEEEEFMPPMESELVEPKLDIASLEDQTLWEKELLMERVKELRNQRQTSNLAAEAGGDKELARKMESFHEFLEELKSNSSSRSASLSSVESVVPVATPVNPAPSASTQPRNGLKRLVSKHLRSVIISTDGTIRDKAPQFKGKRKISKNPSAGALQGSLSRRNQRTPAVAVEEPKPSTEPSSPSAPQGPAPPAPVLPKKRSTAAVLRGTRKQPSMAPKPIDANH